MSNWSMNTACSAACASAPAASSMRSFTTEYAPLLTLGTVLAVLIFLARISLILAVGLAVALVWLGIIRLIMNSCSRQLKADMAR